MFSLSGICVIDGIIRTHAFGRLRARTCYGFLRYCIHIAYIGKSILLHSVQCQTMQYNEYGESASVAVAMGEPRCAACAGSPLNV